MSKHLTLLGHRMTRIFPILLFIGLGFFGCAFQTDIFGNKMNLHNDIISLYDLQRDPLVKNKFYLSFIENGSQTVRKYPQKNITLSKYLGIIMQKYGYDDYMIIEEKNKGTLPLYFDVVVMMKSNQSSRNLKVDPKRKTNNYDDLRKLKSLFDEGVLTKEEFEAKKKQILGL